MNFTMNQFAGANVKGQVDKIITPSTFPCQVISTSNHTFVPGDFVKLAGDAIGGAILIEICAATDVPFGVVPYSVKKNSYVAGEAIDVLGVGSVVFLESGAAIDTGDSLEFVPTGAKVITNAGTNPVCGKSFDTASGAGELVRVLLNSNIAVVQTISGGSVNNSPIGNSVASTGQFTTLAASGTLTVTGNSALGGLTTPVQLVSAVTVLTSSATITLNAGLGNSFTLTAAHNATINASNVKAGQDVYVKVLTSGTDPFILTPGTGFGANAGTLNTGVTTAKTFDLHFHAYADGALTEVSRTTAM